MASCSLARQVSLQRCRIFRLVDNGSLCPLLTSDNNQSRSRNGRVRSFSATTTQTAPPTSNNNNTSASAEEDVDILIVGGGVVGCSLANQLAKRAPDLTIGLVEAKTGPPPLPLSNKKVYDGSLPKPPHPRSYALSPQSLEWLGLTNNNNDNNSNNRLGHYHSMQVWEAGQPASLVFSSQDLASGASAAPTPTPTTLGAVVEDQVLVQHLWDQIRQKNPSSCRIFANSKISEIALPQTATQGKAKVQLLQSSTTTTVPDGSGSSSSSNDATATKTIHANLLIGADGGNSTVRQLAGIARKVLPYHEQRALTFTVKLTDGNGSMRQRAFQRFLSDGSPLALLPTFLPDHAIVVWSTLPEQVQFWKEQPADKLVSHLNGLLQTGPELVQPLFQSLSSSWLDSSSSMVPSPVANVLYGVDKLMEAAHYGPAMMAQESLSSSASAPFAMPPRIHDIVSPKFSFPLQCAQVERYTAPRLALAGDAAHSVHPMAGQGLNLGLQDAAQLVAVICKAHQAGMDVSLLLEHEYEPNRQLSVSLALAAIHGLQRTFLQQNNIPLKHVKSLGMNLIQNVTPLRQQLAHAACYGVALPV